MNDDNAKQFIVVYEWRGKYNAVVIWQFGKRGNVAYAWMLIPAQAEPPDAPPAKACHYTRFMDAWRHGDYAMSHERRVAA